MASSEDMASSETESEMTLTDESSSSSSEESGEEDESQQHPDRRMPVRRGHGGARTRGGNPCASTPRRTSEWVDWSSASLTPDTPQFIGTPGPSIAPLAIMSTYS